jgi:hypothetical protein
MRNLRTGAGPIAFEGIELLWSRGDDAAGERLADEPTGHSTNFAARGMEEGDNTLKKFVAALTDENLHSRAGEIERL